MEKSNSSLLNSRGQVALFVALIFQVLFVFFAMIVNVGLIVHHKINLQNSVDLAAYYGAMKQAEMLNAIGHVNYQIRQSWKLLNYRYNQVGMAGAIKDTPYKPAANGNAESLIEDDTVMNKDFGFCIAYRPMNIVTSTESYCQDAAGQLVIKPGVPNAQTGFGSIFSSFQNQIIATANALKAKAQKGCQFAMATNWMQLAQFIEIYKMDIRNRKKLLLALANKLSVDKPSDIDGDSIKKGVYKTLVKNLTIQSQESLGRFSDDGEGAGSSTANFKYYNSLSSTECGSVGNDLEPPKWMAEMFVFPIYTAIDAECVANDKAINFKQTYFNTGSLVAPPDNVIAEFVKGGKITISQLNDIIQFVSEVGSADPNTKMFRTSLGFEKNPWCVAYTGVSASVTPKIPFSPLGDVTLTARSFAKPFGGRIGPWYSKSWPQNSDTSDMSAVLNQDQIVDRMLPIRVKPDQPIANFNPGDFANKKRLYPNHSRYLGDNAGISSQLTMGQFEKGLQAQTTIDLNWYNHTLDEQFDSPSSGSGDVIAYDKTGSIAPPLRNLEIAAVAPDQFDIANYSIDPDFYNNYLLRIQKAYGSQFQFMLRGDLGSRMQGTDAEKRFSIRNQIEINRDYPKAMIDTATKLTYYLNKIGQVLTSWQQTTPDSYVIDTARFGKCGESSADDDKLIAQDAQEKDFAAGSCKAGGRTGYSVKLVDGKFLKNEVNGKTQSYELGGKGVSGQIKNPPPDNF